VTIKLALRWLLTLIMVGSGIYHFANAPAYVAMMPDFLPAHLELVYISGIAEAAGGLGLILPQTRRLAAWGLVALLVAVFPANINMAINDIPLDGNQLPSWALWARLPFQLVFIAWAYWFTRDDRRTGV
jgi:uncharacterized membrane protein